MKNNIFSVIDDINVITITEKNTEYEFFDQFASIFNPCCYSVGSAGYSSCKRVLHLENVHYYHAKFVLTAVAELMARYGMPNSASIHHTLTVSYNDNVIISGEDEEVHCNVYTCPIEGFWYYSNGAANPRITLKTFYNLDGEDSPTEENIINYGLYSGDIIIDIPQNAVE